MYTLLSHSKTWGTFYLHIPRILGTQWLPVTGDLHATVRLTEGQNEKAQRNDAVSLQNQVRTHRGTVCVA